MIFKKNKQTKMNEFFFIFVSFIPWQLGWNGGKDKWTPVIAPPVFHEHPTSHSHSPHPIHPIPRTFHLHIPSIGRRRRAPSSSPTAQQFPCRWFSLSIDKLKINNNTKNKLNKITNTHPSNHTNPKSHTNPSHKPTKNKRKHTKPITQIKPNQRNQTKIKNNRTQNTAKTNKTTQHHTTQNWKMKQEKEHTTLHIDAYIIPHSNVDMEARKNTRRAEEEGEEDLGDGWEHKIKNKKDTNINTTHFNFISHHMITFSPHNTTSSPVTHHPIPRH